MHILSTGIHIPAGTYRRNIIDDFAPSIIQSRPTSSFFITQVITANEIKALSVAGSSGTVAVPPVQVRSKSI